MASHALTTSLSRLPAPTSSPAQIAFWPIASNTGRTRSSSPRSPEGSSTSDPCSAGSFVPTTGVSRNATPASRAWAASRSIPSMPTVEVCTHTVSGPNDGSASAIVAATASASKSIVRTTSASVTASAAESTTTAPSSASGSALSRVRFHARTPCPARSRLCAIPEPISPVPRTATVKVTAVLLVVDPAVVDVVAGATHPPGPFTGRPSAPGTIRGVRRPVLITVLLLALTGCASTTTPPAPPAPAAATAPSPQPCSTSTTISGWSDALEGQRFAGRTPAPQVVGNLSALTALPDGRVLALSDRSVLFTLDAAADRPLDAVALADPAGTALDSESLVVDRDGSLLIGDETGPQVLRVDRDGRLLGALPVPPDVVTRGKPNTTLEGLALSPDGRTLVASVEEPLTGDDPGLTRLVTWTRPDPSSPAFTPGAQYALPLPAGLGVSELTPTGDGRLLALEHGYEKATGNTVHLVLLDPAGATDVADVAALGPATAGTPVRATLLADLGACPALGATAKQPQANPLLDNIEGMTVTGRAPDGALELLLVSDDNDSPQEVTRTYRLRTTLG